MLLLVRKYTRLLVPYLWKTKKCLLATLTTFFIMWLRIYLALYEVELFSNFIATYQKESIFFLSKLLIAFVAMKYIRKGLRSLADIIFFYVMNETIRDLRFQLAHRLHQMDLTTYTNYSSIEAINASKRISMSVRKLMGSFLDIVFKVFYLGSFCYKLLKVHPDTQYFLGSIGVIIVVYHFLMGKYWSLHRRAIQKSDHVMHKMKESLSNVKYAKFYPEDEKETLRHIFDKEAKSWWYTETYRHFLMMIKYFLYFVVISIFFLHFCSLLQHGLIGKQDFLRVKGLTFKICMKVSLLVGFCKKLGTQAVNLEKVIKMTELPKDRTDLSAKCFSLGVPILEVKQVDFGYEKNKKLLKMLSLTVREGDKIAIVGDSGSGKSTLCHLLAGLYLPNQGKVLFKGVATQELHPQDMAKSLHFINQDAYMTGGCIRKLVANKAHRTNVLPLGYLNEELDKVVGENGNRVSSGEKQRIFVARCLSAKPEVVILDESVSCLDEKSAQKLLQLLMSEIATVILITHRHSLLHSFSKVYTLQDGRLEFVSAHK